MEIFSTVWDAVNGNAPPWFGNLANVLQIFQGLILPVFTAIAGWIFLKVRNRKPSFEPTPAPEPTPEIELQPEPELDSLPRDEPKPDSSDRSTVLETPFDPTKDEVLRKYDLLLTNYTPGKKFAIRSLAPPPPLFSFGFFLFIFWAEGTTFLFAHAASNSAMIALTACILVSIFLRFRWDHGTVVEINHEKRHIWVFKEYSMYGGGNWPPIVAFNISYDDNSKLFCATVSLQGYPIARSMNARRDRLEKKFVPLVSYLKSLANLPARREWRFGMGGPGA